MLDVPCYKPISAYHGPGGATFDRKSSFGTPIELPCRRCLGCQLQHAKDWALRCHHEASLYGDNNSFITLTYDDHHLPKNSNLEHLHFQKFIRATRQKFKQKIRYYMCGEYGSKCEKHKQKDCPECGSIQRPHYHAILFNFTFPDPYYWRTENGNKFYRSPALEKLWYHGNSDISAVTFESAGYVARYILAKQTGEYGERAYGIPDVLTGEITSQKKAPYTAMSLKPGIGKDWYTQFKGDLFPHDFAILPTGVQTQVPAYYRKLLQKEDPDLFNLLRNKRLAKAKNDPNSTPERLSVREICHEAKASKLQRNL